MVQHATSEHGLARHQKMVEAESEHGSMEASEEHEIRSTEDQKMVSRNRSTSRSEDQKMHCTKLLTLMIFKCRIHKHQIRRKYRWQTTLTDKRNVKATK